MPVRLEAALTAVLKSLGESPVLCVELPAAVECRAKGLGLPLPHLHGSGLHDGIRPLALEALGFLPALEEVEVPLGQRFHPDRVRHRAYLEASRKHDRLYRLLLPGRF